jgi:Na+-transporting NADH:ubiquinone oxidoreductase subunit NqrB
LIGRVIVQFFFVSHLSLSGTLAVSPVLARGHLLFGDITRSGSVATFLGWGDTIAPSGRSAHLLERPVQSLRRFAQDGVASDGDLNYTPLLRDVLPPWSDTLWGAVPGGIGETSTLVLIVVGLYLISRGYLRWQLPVVMLASAAVAASILPVELHDDYRWFPVLKTEQNHAVGLAYVLYHLTAGQLMLGAFLLAGDVTASPMRIQGQLVFAVGIGVLTIFMRLYGVLSGECYWSILIMNALVGTIDRWMRRPVLGLADS